MFSNKTVGNDEIGVQIGDFLIENPMYRRRFLRRINNFNRVVNEIVRSKDISPETKVSLFNRVFHDARKNANFINYREGSNNSIKESYPSYLLITYFKTVWDRVMPFLDSRKNLKRLWNDNNKGDNMRAVYHDMIEADILSDINDFIQRKVVQLRKL